MSTVKLLTSALVIGALAATSAMAGGWPNASAKKAAESRDDCCGAKNASTSKSQASKAARLVSPDGFEYLGGDNGWQFAQHKFEYRGGRLGHASDCPVSIAKGGGNLRPSASGTHG